MLSQAELVGFIPTVDPDRARRFYIDLLGLNFVSEDPFAIVVRSNTSTIRIVPVAAFNPSPHTLLGWEVADIEATTKEFSASGITFERYPYFEQDADGIWTAPEGRAKVAWFKDPDGNVLSVSQHF